MQEGHSQIQAEPPRNSEAPKKGFFTPLKERFVKTINSLRNRIGGIQDFKDASRETLAIEQARAVIEYGGLDEAKAARPELFGIQVEKTKKSTR